MQILLDLLRRNLIDTKGERDLSIEQVAQTLCRFEIPFQQRLRVVVKNPGGTRFADSSGWWVHDLVEKGKAIDLGGYGYPHRYTKNIGSVPSLQL